jgi:hypothetical protein
VLLQFLLWLFAPDILAGMHTITFDAEPDVADNFEKLCRITNLSAEELINRAFVAKYSR